MEMDGEGIIGKKDGIRLNKEEFKECLELILENIPKEKEVHLLDIGCVAYSQYQALQSFNPNIYITGIDTYESLKCGLKGVVGERIKNLRIIYEDYQNVNFEKDAYDFVISSVEIGNDNRREIAKYHQNISKAIQKNGVLLEIEYIDSVYAGFGILSSLLEVGFKTVEIIWKKGHFTMLKASK